MQLHLRLSGVFLIGKIDLAKWDWMTRRCIVLRGPVPRLIAERLFICTSQRLSVSATQLLLETLAATSADCNVKPVTRHSPCSRNARNRTWCCVAAAHSYTSPLHSPSRYTVPAVSGWWQACHVWVAATEICPQSTIASRLLQRQPARLSVSPFMWVSEALYCYCCGSSDPYCWRYSRCQASISLELRHTTLHRGRRTWLGVSNVPVVMAIVPEPLPVVLR